MTSKLIYLQARVVAIEKANHDMLVVAGCADLVKQMQPPKMRVTHVAIQDHLDDRRARTRNNGLTSDWCDGWNATRAPPGPGSKPHPQP